MLNDHGRPEYPLGPIPHAPLKGYRTILFSSLTAICGILATIDWGSVIPVQWAGMAVAAIGLVNAILRFITNTPIAVSIPPVKSVMAIIEKHEASIPSHVIQDLKRAAPDAKL